MRVCGTIMSNLLHWKRLTWHYSTVRGSPSPTGDCLILAAAKQSGCDAVYSEDMSAGQDYDGIRVINPFGVESEPARV